MVWPHANKNLLESLSNHFWSNYFQRSLGILVFIVLTAQVFIGAFRKRLSDKFGQWVLGVHLLQGKILYGLILAHSISYLFYMYFFTGKINPFYIFTDFCLLCEQRRELFVSMGRIAFIFLNLTIATAIFRHAKAMVGNWNYIHKINYIIFFMISLHFYFVGSDIKYLSIKILFYFCNLLVFSTVVAKTIPLIKKFRLK